MSYKAIHEVQGLITAMQKRYAYYSAATWCQEFYEYYQGIAPTRLWRRLKRPRALL